MAETNTSILKQISAQQPVVSSNTFFVLVYSDRDKQNRFPDGFAEWGFPYALKLLYSNPTIDGKIIRQEELPFLKDKLHSVHFVYKIGDRGQPVVEKSSQ